MRVTPFAYLGQKEAVTDGIVTSNLWHNYDANNTSSYPGTGTTLYDLQGNNNMTIYGTTAHGTYGGLSNVFNIPANSYSYMQIASGETNIDIANGISMEMWVYVPSYDNPDWYYSLYNGESSNRQVFRFEPTIGGGPNGNSGAVQYDKYVNNSNTYTNALTMNTSTWYHAVMTYYPGRFNYYLNNVSAGNVNFTAPTTHFGTSKTLYLSLSRRDDRTSDNFGMICSEWRFYKKELSSAEVTQNWNATKTRFGY